MKRSKILPQRSNKSKRNW